PRRLRGKPGLRMVEMGRRLRRHDHVVARSRGDDPAVLAAPAHHRRPGRETAFEDCIPPDKPPAELREPRIEMPDEPRLQLVHVLQTLALHAVLRRRRVAPLGLGTLVAADVYEFRGE